MSRWLICLLLVGVTALPAARPVPDEKPLDVIAKGLGGWDAVRAGRTFAYRLKITDQRGTVQRDALYRLELANGHIWSKNLQTGEETWWDGTSGWHRFGKGEAVRDDDAAKTLGEHAAYNFLRLLRDPETRAEWRDALGLQEVRLVPAGRTAFMATLVPDGGWIRMSRFGDITVFEGRYEKVGALVWPMQFDVHNRNGPTSTGSYSEIALLDEPALAPVQ